MDKTIFFMPPARGPALGFAQLCRLLGEAGIPHVIDGNIDSFGRRAIYFGNEAELLVALPTLAVEEKNGVIKEGILICESKYEDRLPRLLQFFANIRWESNELD